MTPGSSVTVVIASRDRPDMARRAVSCALAQVGAPVEVVLVDDASVTPLAVSLEDLVERVGPRLRIVRNEVSLGVSRARNRGIAAARGEWVGFCDDDDVWAPIKVREQLEVARDDQVTWTVSSAMAVAEDNHELKAMRAPSAGDASADLLANNVVPGGASSVIARTAVVRDIGGFDPAFSTLADWELWTRLARTGLLASVHRPLVGYLVHPAGMSNDIKLLESDMAKLERKYHDLRRARGRRHLSAGVDELHRPHAPQGRSAPRRRSRAECGCPPQR